METLEEKIAELSPERRQRTLQHAAAMISEEKPGATLKAGRNLIDVDGSDAGHG